MHPSVTVVESHVEKPSAVPHWSHHHQPQLLPGSMWVHTTLFHNCISNQQSDCVSVTPLLLPCVLTTCLACCTVSWDNLRIPGVLQRLAWSYLVVASLDLLVAKGYLDIYAPVSQPTFFKFFYCYLIPSPLRFDMWILCFQEAWWSKGVDILMYWPAWLCILGLETVWLCLTFLLPVPDCPQYVKRDIFSHYIYVGEF